MISNVDKLFFDFYAYTFISSILMLFFLVMTASFSFSKNVRIVSFIFFVAISFIFIGIDEDGSKISSKICQEFNESNKSDIFECKVEFMFKENDSKNGKYLVIFKAKENLIEDTYDLEGKKISKKIEDKSQKMYIKLSDGSSSFRFFVEYILNYSNNVFLVDKILKQKNTILESFKNSE